MSSHLQCDNKGLRVSVEALPSAEERATLRLKMWSDGARRSLFPGVHLENDGALVFRFCLESEGSAWSDVAEGPLADQKREGRRMCALR